MVIIYTGHTERPYYRLHHSQRNTCRDHNGNGWLKGTGDCDVGRQKRGGRVDKTTSINVNTEALSDDNEK
jgi:hypothetical protein